MESQVAVHHLRHGCPEIEHDRHGAGRREVEQVDPTLLDNFVSNRLLSPRGSDCDNRPLQVDKVQGCRNCRIFARFPVWADLCQG